MKQIPWLLFAVALAALLAVGCASPNTSGMTAGMAMGADGVMRDYLQVANTRLARNYSVSDITAGQSRNGMMKAGLKLTSNRNKTTDIQYKFMWFDADGVEIDPGSTPWRPITLNGRETCSLNGVAPSAAAVTFRLSIREGEMTKKYIH